MNGSHFYTYSYPYIRIPSRIPIPSQSQQFAHIPLALSMRLVGSWLMMTKVGAPWKAERNVETGQKLNQQMRQMRKNWGVGIGHTE